MAVSHIHKIYWTHNDKDTKSWLAVIPSFSVKQKSRMEIVPVFCDTLAYEAITTSWAFILLSVVTMALDRIYRRLFRPTLQELQ